MNQIIVTGRLTASPELKQTQNGTSVCRFSVAVPRNFNKKETDFLDVTAWRQAAEVVCRNFQKGQSIAVVGEVNVQTYEQNGQNRRAWQIVASRVEFCGGKSENGGEQSQGGAQRDASSPAPAPSYGQENTPTAGWGQPTQQPQQQTFYPGFADMTAFDDPDLPF